MMSLFHEFGSSFRADERSSGLPWDCDAMRAAAGYDALANEYGGQSFASGLYRIHDAAAGPVARRLVAEAFPDFAERAVPFGADWLGRQFAIDLGRTVNREPQILMLEPGTGEVLEVPCDLVAFHNSELVEYRDAALAADFFYAWAEQNPDRLPLAPEICVGYRVPLFLGGADTLDNLELIDLEVYWSFCAQLHRGSISMREGDTVSSISRAGDNA